MDIAVLQPMTNALAVKFRSISGAPGTIPKAEKSHPMTFRAIALAERLHAELRNSGNREATAQELEETSQLAVALQEAGIE